MNVRSAKSKGRRLQNLLRDLLRKSFPTLDENDITSQIMGCKGEDIILSPLARKTIRYSFECKNKERLNLWESLQQAEDNCEDRTPVLVFNRNRCKVYVALELDKFLDLIKEK